MECKSVKFNEFNSQSDNWDNYIERLKYCFEANGIVSDAVQRANFFTVCGAQVYETVLALITPRKTSDVTFTEIVIILTRHYSPKPNEISVSFQFYKRDQREGESVAEYIAQLRKISAGCNFTDLERMLRDRLVCGMSDKKLQYELLKRDNLQYSEVVDTMLSSESAVKDVRMMQCTPRTNMPIMRQIITPVETGSSPPYEPMEVNALQSRNKLRLCYRCGDRHGGDCRFANVVCNFCNKKGHIEKICIAKKKSRGSKIHYAEDSDTQLNGIYNLETTTTRVPAYKVRVSLNGVPVLMEVDSGAAFSILNEQTWRLLQSTTVLEDMPNRLRTWNNSPVQVMGQAKVQVQYKDIKRNLSIVIARGCGPNLLGRNWFQALDITLNIFVIDTDMTDINNVINKYPKVFREGLGTYKGDPVDIQVKQNAIPKFLKARPVPYALKERIEKEIDRLVGEGVLKPVTFSAWATPVVPIVKRNGDIRLCGDYRSTVNQATESDTYPMPTASEVFATIGGGCYYTTLDLDRAYTQVVVSDKTAKLLTLNTCKGLYSVHRLAFGVKACPGIFQRLMTSLLAGTPGVAVLIDDIIISGRTLTEMSQRLDTVLHRIENSGLRLNRDKCKFARQQVEFLGFVIDADGIHPAQSKVQSIMNTPEPKNVQQLQAFLGLYNFYERFIPHKATVLEPLHRLLDKSKTWQWTDQEQNSFNTAKQLLSSELTLVHYDLHKPLVLTCDSSEYGVGAVLSHVMEDETERPVAMGSRTLHMHERRYSQLDKEATAIMFGIAKFHNYLMGRTFTIVTDHKPLLGIFDPKRPMPTVLSPRLTRIALLLTSHSYNIIYKPGTEIGNADGLSRWPQPVFEEPEPTLSDVLLMAETPADFPIDIEHIASATKRDRILSRVSHYILGGWPIRVTDSEIRPYWLRRSELSLHEDCLLFGNRVVVPSSLQEVVLSTLHKVHSGMVQTKALARSYVWWPQLNHDIEVLISNCNKCLENRHMPAKTSYKWITPTKPWSRINIDFAGPFQNKTFLVVVDAYSKWPEVLIVNNMTSGIVIQHLRNLFAIHGLCETLVSDNGTPFVSLEMKDFLKANKITHITTAPYHPATNGLAERMIQTVKDKLRKMEDIPWDIRLPNMLLGLRTTPCTTTNKSPAELLMNRRLHTLLDTLHPDSRERRKRTKQILNNAQKNYRETNVGLEVMYRNYARGPRWLPGTVLNRKGPSNYQVCTKEGFVINRHIDQLIRKRQPVGTEEAQKEEGETLQQDDTLKNREITDSDLRTEMTDDDMRDEETDYDLREEATDSNLGEEIIEIPSQDKWAEMLGIPTNVEPSFSGGKVKNKTKAHLRSPYDRLNQFINFMA